MKQLDLVLQHWRIRTVLPYLKRGAKVLDIGSADGTLFQCVPQLSAGSFGIDPVLPRNLAYDRFALIRGFFPKDMPPNAGPFDAITMLAVLEHFPEQELAALADGCVKYLVPGGLLLITVPSPSVDAILVWLLRFRLIDGMSLEEHHGYKVEQTPLIFSEPAFTLVRHQTFQCGLNNLFVFRRR